MSADPGSNTKLVYVRLLNEGTNVYRPVEAALVGGGIVKLVASPDYDSEDEEWQFKPGSVVVLKEQILEGKKVLVATSLVSDAS